MRSLECFAEWVHGPQHLSIVNLRLFLCERLVQDDMWCGQSHFRILSLIELLANNQKNKDRNVWRVTIIIQLSLIYQKKNVAKTIMFDLLDLIRKLLSQIIIGVCIIRWFILMDELQYFNLQHPFDLIPFEHVELQTWGNMPHKPPSLAYIFLYIYLVNKLL